MDTTFVRKYVHAQCTILIDLADIAVTFSAHPVHQDGQSTFILCGNTIDYVYI